MTCPYVTVLLASAADTIGHADQLVVPTGCDAMRRAGEALAARLPGRVWSLQIPRGTEPAAVDALSRDLETLLAGLTEHADSDSNGQVPESSALFAHPPTKGGAFIVAGPLSDDGLPRFVEALGLQVSGVESCTGPDRAGALAAFDVHGTGDPTPASANPTVTTTTWTPQNAQTGARADGDRADFSAGPRRAAAIILEGASCPRSTVGSRRSYLARRLDETAARAVIYARLPFCDPGAYDALTICRLASERGLPFLEVEVAYPFEPAGPLRVRIEAFLETLLLEADLLGPDADLFGEGESSGDDPECRPAERPEVLS